MLKYICLLLAKTATAPTTACTSAYSSGEVVFQLASVANLLGTYAISCPNGGVQDGSSVCAYVGIDSTQCIVASTNSFSLQCVSSSGTVDSPQMCTVKVMDPSNPVNSITSFVATVTGVTSSVTIVDVTGSSTVANTFTVKYGSGVFAVYSTVPKSAGSALSLSIAAYTLPNAAGAIAAPSAAVSMSFGVGAPAKVSTLVISPSMTTYPAGTVMTLSYSAFDQYSNLATGATGQLVSLVATPATGTSWTSSSALTFASGVGSTKLTCTVVGTYTISMVQGSLLLSPPITFTETNTVTIINGSPASYRLQISATALTVGTSIPAVLTALDAYGNVCTTGADWDMQVVLSSGGSSSSVTGTLASGTQSFTISCSSAGTATISVVDPGSHGVALPSALSVPCTAASTESSALIIGVTVGVSAFVAIVLLIIGWQIYKRKTMQAEASRIKTVGKIHEVFIKDDQSTADPSDIGSDFDTSAETDAARLAKQQVEQVQALVLTRLANVAASKQPTEGVLQGAAPSADSRGAFKRLETVPELSDTAEASLGVVGVLNKLTFLLNRAAKNADSSDADMAAFNELLASRGSTYLTAAEVQELKALGNQVGSILRNKRMAALEKAAQAEAKMTALTTELHGKELSDLLAQQARDATQEESQAVLGIEKPVEELGQRDRAGRATLISKWEGRISKASSESEKHALLAESREAFASLDADAENAREQLRLKLKSACEARAAARKDRHAAAISKLMQKQEAEVAKVLAEVATAKREAADVLADSERVIDSTLVEGGIATSAMLRSANADVKSKMAEVKKQMQEAVSNNSVVGAEKAQILQNHEAAMKRLEDAEEQELLSLKAAMKSRSAARKASIAANREPRLQAELKLSQAEAQASLSELALRRAENERLAAQAAEFVAVSSSHVVNSALNANLALSELQGSTTVKVAQLRMAGRADEATELLDNLAAAESAAVAQSQALSDTQLQSARLILNDKEAGIKSDIASNREQEVRRLQRSVAEARQSVENAAEDSAAAMSSSVEADALLLSDAALRVIEKSGDIGSNSAIDDLVKAINDQKVEIIHAAKVLVNQDTVMRNNEAVTEKALREVQKEQAALASEVVSQNLSAHTSALGKSNKELANAAKQRVKDLSSNHDPVGRQLLLDQWKESLKFTEERIAQDDQRERDNIQARAAARKKKLDDKRKAVLSIKDQSTALKVIDRLQYAMAVSRSKKTNHERHQDDMSALRKQHEQQEVQLKAKMQAEMDRLSSELAKIENEKKDAAIKAERMKKLAEAKEAKTGKEELAQMKAELDMTARQVSSVMNEEAEIQAAIMQKKLKARQDRLMKTQQAMSVQNKKDDILAQLDFEKRQLDSITDVNELVTALARVNELQGKLTDLNNQLAN